MAISTFEGVVEAGQIRLRNNVTLPENAKVFVVIPDYETPSRSHVYSSGLVRREQDGDFTKQVIEVSTDDGL